MKTQPSTERLAGAAPQGQVRVNIFQKAFLDAYEETREIREVFRRKSEEYAAEQAAAGNAASGHGAAAPGNSHADR